MGWESLVVFALLAAAIPLFASERVSFDVVALGIVAVLLLTGIVTPEQGFAGFSNSATITIAAMFVLSEGLRRTGALERVSRLFRRLGEESPWRALVTLMAVVSAVSAFINNTAAVAIFLPVVLQLARDLDWSASKLLIPLSFASMFGGACTLIGTSTNILVSSLAEEQGLAPLSMFELAPLGLVLLAVGFAYLLFVAVPRLPQRRCDGDLSASYEMNEYLTEAVVTSSFEPLGEPIDLEALSDRFDCDVVALAGSPLPEDTVTLAAGDVLRLRGGTREIDRLRRRDDLVLEPRRTWSEGDLVSGDDRLVEAVIAPESPFESRRVADLDLRDRFGATLLALRHHGELQDRRLAAARLSGGDSLLLAIDAERVSEIQRAPSFVLVSTVEPETGYRSSRLPFALAVLVFVVASASFGWLPIAVSAPVGCLALVLGGAITMGEAYEAIQWKVIFLLAGVLPLGEAMAATDAAEVLTAGVLSLVGDLGPHAVVGGFFFLSMMLTNVISNQATAVLLAPIAVEAGSEIGLEVRPLLLAVTYAASLSFMTPVGYQTNTLIYGPGQYRFSDFLKIGTPLNLLVWAVSTLLIPVIWTV